MNPSLLSLIGGIGAANMGGGWGSQPGSDLQVHSSDGGKGMGGIDPRLLALLGGGIFSNAGQSAMQSPAGMGLLGGMGMGGGRAQQSNLMGIAAPAMGLLYGRR